MSVDEDIDFWDSIGFESEAMVLIKSFMAAEKQKLDKKLNRKHKINGS